jgi:hypothetical protein
MFCVDLARFGSNQASRDLRFAFRTLLIRCRGILKGLVEELAGFEPLTTTGSETSLSNGETVEARIEEYSTLVSESTSSVSVWDDVGCRERKSFSSWAMAVNED